MPIFYFFFFFKFGFLLVLLFPSRHNWSKQIQNKSIYLTGSFLIAAKTLSNYSPSRGVKGTTQFTAYQHESDSPTNL